MPIFKSEEEDKYFHNKNKAALERLATRKREAAKEKPRLSPITGEPMVQEVMGAIVIDRCPTSGGIWLDAGELEQLIEAAKESEKDSSVLSTLIKSLKGK